MGGIAGIRNRKQAGTISFWLPAPADQRLRANDFSRKGHLNKVNELDSISDSITTPRTPFLRCMVVSSCVTEIPLS